MRKCDYIWILLFGLLSSCSSEPVTDEALLRELDECIAHRAEYHQLREACVDSLEAQLKQCLNDSAYFETCGRLVEVYRSYNLDSQLYYTEERMRIAATPFEKQASLLNYSEILMRSAMYHESLQYMDSATKKPLDPILEPYYHHLRRTVFGLMRDFAVTERERKTYTAITQQYRESMMAVHPAGSFLHELVRADYLYEKGLYDSALHVLSRYENEHAIEGEYEEPVFAFTRAQIYHAKGETEHEKHYLILASLADLKNAIREYVALRNLSVLLYQEGDIDRAYAYMQCAIQDASDGSARVRSIEADEIHPVVEEAYMHQVRKRYYGLIALIASSLIIVAMLVLFLLYSYRKRHQLATLNAQLMRANSDLKQSNQIKTAYVGRYMEISSLLIDRFDAWRKQLKGLAQERQYEKLTTTISSQQFTQEQLSAFYADFDEAFLELFPTFITDVKALLVPEAELRFKKGERLNTDLRVLALIRLGISDSRQISDFLRCSLSTIYNSRTRMRNLYKGDREEFERKIESL